MFVIIEMKYDPKTPNGINDSTLMVNEINEMIIRFSNLLIMNLYETLIAFIRLTLSQVIMYSAISYKAKRGINSRSHKECVKISIFASS
jgi:hypothetical protein